ncbi:transmembrane protein 79-like isoform X2 [Rhincodon typus]|nr:transmembrane protein 79-like isoform X2 [Rhincodon typus]XP_048476374.1 transmembrane protein 79-like isoform X2 [Rhincodon typus]
MSGTLPVPQNARDEDSASERGSKEEDESAGSPGTLERGDAPLLHTSDTLEYPGGGRFPVAEETGLEMKALRQASAAEGAQAPPVAAEKGPGPESEVWVPPPAVDPTVRVVVARTLSKESERQAFLTGHCPLPDSEWPGANGEEEGSYGGDMGKRPCCPRCSRPNLKATASLAGAVLVYPCFLYGAYVFLPFDVPIMPDISARLMYTLRCGVFATVPIIMGIIVYGLARCCSSAVDPFGPRREEVEIHLRFVTDSIHLFVLFFVNLMVLSTYLPQEVLKLLPLLTAFFALARLIYWVTFTISSSFRGFGYGLTFFPILGLVVVNLCYMFVLAPDKMFATSPSELEEKDAGSSTRQRFWG